MSSKPQTVNSFEKETRQNVWSAWTARVLSKRDALHELLIGDACALFRLKGDVSVLDPMMDAMKGDRRVREYPAYFGLGFRVYGGNRYPQEEAGNPLQRSYLTQVYVKSSDQE